ncbi:HepT-like ribonuclease domain-containing protein [Rhodococcus sp. HNM0563]|uniref:HepT-like ribonuclease domain-containing protein n=1 Tax=Rhodococcus sp. HNM0563 TaxID=2716339 RepID=UPI003217CCCC
MQRLCSRARSHCEPRCRSAHQRRTPRDRLAADPGCRNIFVHQYFGADVDVVRDVVETYLPPLA